MWSSFFFFSFPSFGWHLCPLLRKHTNQSRSTAKTNVLLFVHFLFSFPFLFRFVEGKIFLWNNIFMFLGGSQWRRQSRRWNVEGSSSSSSSSKKKKESIAWSVLTIMMRAEGVSGYRLATITWQYSFYELCIRHQLPKKEKEKRKTMKMTCPKNWTLDLEWVESRSYRSLVKGLNCRRPVGYSSTEMVTVLKRKNLYIVVLFSWFY